jgi:WD40 repeat protein
MWRSLLTLEPSRNDFCALAANSRRIVWCDNNDNDNDNAAVDTDSAVFEYNFKTNRVTKQQHQQQQHQQQQGGKIKKLKITSLFLTENDTLILGQGRGENVHLGFGHRSDLSFVANCGNDSENASIVDVDYDQNTHLLAVATETRVQIFNKKNEIVDGFATDIGFEVQAPISSCTWTERNRLLVMHGDEHFFLTASRDGSRLVWNFEEADFVQKFKLKVHCARRWSRGVMLMGKTKVYLMDQTCTKLIKTVQLPVGARLVTACGDSLVTLCDSNLLSYAL